MSAFKVFDIAGSGMVAQSMRLNLVASNLANAESTSSSLGETYRARMPVFAAALQDAKDKQGASVGVDVLGVVESNEQPRMEYMPHHPKANEAGYVFKSNVNSIEEMTNMLSASRSYQDNVEVANTAKQLLMQTLRMGQ